MYQSSVPIITFSSTMFQEKRVLCFVFMSTVLSHPFTHSHDAQALDAEVTRKLGEVGLEDKADAMAASLSGGQKRKLSGALAQR